MDTLTEQFDSVYVDTDEELTAETREAEASAIPAAAIPVPAPLAAKPLRGYEQIMRQHAAACEAGR
jgi:hypothetical protein